MLLGNRLRYIDRKKLGFAALAGGRDDGLGGDLAVQRPDRHEGIDGGIAGHFADLIDGELHHRHLVGSNAGLAQNNPEQRDVGVRSSDHGNAVSLQIVEAFDLGRWALFGALGR